MEEVENDVVQSVKGQLCKWFPFVCEYLCVQV